jgi:hypothetical protein
MRSRIKPFSEISPMTPKQKAPAVRMAKPAGRPIQLRYTDRDTGKEIRISKLARRTKRRRLNRKKI